MQGTTRFATHELLHPDQTPEGEPQVPCLPLEMIVELIVAIKMIQRECLGRTKETVKP